MIFILMAYLTFDIASETLSQYSILMFIGIHTHMYVCVCVCMYVCMYVCILYKYITLISRHFVSRELWKYCQKRTYTSYILHIYIYILYTICVCARDNCGAAWQRWKMRGEKYKWKIKILHVVPTNITTVAMTYPCTIIFSILYSVILIPLYKIYLIGKMYVLENIFFCFHYTLL